MLAPNLVSHVTCHMCHLSHVLCPISCVTCHVSHVMCHRSDVTCQIYIFVFWQIGRASVWRVCYQQGLPRPVYLRTCGFFCFVLVILSSHGERCSVSRMLNISNNFSKKTTFYNLCAENIRFRRLSIFFYDTSCLARLALKYSFP